MIDPQTVTFAGPYVREVDERDPAFLEFCEAVRKNQDIGQPISVRLAGDPMDPEYVLVYGMRRLMAARRAGLARIPARNYGHSLSEEQAFLLQVVENEARKDPSPGETAHGFAVLLGYGEREKDAAIRAGRSESYVSYMSRVGEAMIALSADERKALYSPDVLQVRTCQEIGKLRALDERVGALRALLEGARPRVSPRGPRQRLSARSSRRTGGRSFRVTWTPADLEDEAGAAFLAEVEAFLEQELETIRSRRAELA